MRDSGSVMQQLELVFKLGNKIAIVSPFYRRKIAIVSFFHRRKIAIVSCFYRRADAVLEQCQCFSVVDLCSAAGRSRRTPPRHTPPGGPA